MILYVRRPEKSRARQKQATNIATHIVAVPLSEPDVLLIIDEAGLDLG